MYGRPYWITALAFVGLSVTATWSLGQDPAPSPEQGETPQVPAPADLPEPMPIPEVELGPVLPTTPVRRQVAGPNVTIIDASALPRDREGIWILDFAFKPVRAVTVELPGKGRRQVFYLYYRVINRTGQPRMFVPQFTMITRTGPRGNDRVRRFDDVPLPNAVPVIQAREEPTNPVPLLGTVASTGILPPSGEKEGVDDAIFGVACWDDIDAEADSFSIYVRGLSDGYRTVEGPDSKPITQYKTLRIDFDMPGDERNLNEREIHLLDPPYEWIYW